MTRKESMEYNGRIKHTVRLLIKEKANIDNISPNYIAEFAYNQGIMLSSKEVVYINNNIEKFIEWYITNFKR